MMHHYLSSMRATKRLQDVADDEIDFFFFQNGYVDQFLNIVVISWKLCVAPVKIMLYQKRMAFSMVSALLKNLRMVSVRFVSCSCLVGVAS